MKYVKLLFLLLTSVGFSSHSQASIVNQFISIDQSGPVVSVTNNSIQTFDQSLGTLNSVQLNLNGFLSVSGTYTPNMVWGGLVPTPVPYGVNFKVDHALYGAVGLDGFGFSTPATYLFSTVATGIPGEGYMFQKAFNFDFVFDDLSDLLGFALPSNTSGPNIPPTLINGLTAEFAHSNLLLFSRLITEDHSGMPNVPLISLHALLSVTYDYTPIQQVPEPDTLVLLGISLLSLAASCRKAKPYTA
ncbi:MAG: PEP-CTERM sorting domain-containing protein [Azonexus sp.]